MRSSQSNINQELEIIRKTLERFGEGFSLDTIKEASGLEIEARTLQRRLDKLKETGIVTTSGKTPSTLYYQTQASVAQNNVVNEESVVPIPLSHEGKEIRKAVSWPPAVRRPVGYNWDFLLNYRPNKDSYLTTDDKIKLASLGKTVRLDQPAGTYAFHAYLISW